MALKKYRLTMSHYIYKTPIANLPAVLRQLTFDWCTPEIFIISSAIVWTKANQNEVWVLAHNPHSPYWLWHELGQQESKHGGPCPLAPNISQCHSSISLMSSANTKKTWWQLWNVNKMAATCNSASTIAGRWLQIDTGMFTIIFLSIYIKLNKYLASY